MAMKLNFVRFRGVFGGLLRAHASLCGRGSIPAQVDRALGDGPSDVKLHPGGLICGGLLACGRGHLGGGLTLRDDLSSISLYHECLFCD